MLNEKSRADTNIFGNKNYGRTVTEPSIDRVLGHICGEAVGVGVCAALTGAAQRGRAALGERGDGGLAVHAGGHGAARAGVHGLAQQAVAVLGLRLRRLLLPVLVRRLRLHELRHHVPAHRYTHTV